MYICTASFYSKGQSGERKKTLNFKVSASFLGAPKIVLSEDLSEFLCMQREHRAKTEWRMELFCTIK